MSSDEDFLKRKFNLHQSDEVEAAAKRHEKRTGEAISRSNANALIRTYLNRFKEILDRPDITKREQGLLALKQVLHDKFIIKEEEIPASYWENIRRIARERGQGADLEQVDWETLKHQTADGLIADQRASLDAWIDYLSSSDAPYPDWLKYFALRSILNMGEYDKKNKKYTKRSKGTVKPYPDINREALALVLDALQKKISRKKIDEHSESFQKLLQTENFAKLYAHAIEECTPASQEQLESTAGTWIMYKQGSDCMPLVRSIQGHGTGWCTAGESTAKTQLEQGDFYVYYSNDADGKPTIPRAAIRMEGGKIAEVRGIAEEQNLDASIAPVVEKKLSEFPDGKAYSKKVSDMKRLTLIEQKTEDNEPLNRNDLLFLYEVDHPIEGFGYEEDPRIEELRSQRNVKEDLPVLFNCAPQEIATSPQELSPSTKAYIGTLQPGIFDLFRKYNIEHIYTSFPEGSVHKLEHLIGGRSSEQMLSKLHQQNAHISPHAQNLAQSPDYFTPDMPEKITFFSLTVQQMGFPHGATTSQILGTKEHDFTDGIMTKLGFQFCPPGAGPELLADEAIPRGQWNYIGMKPITDSDGSPLVFTVRSGGVRPDLDGRWAGPSYLWHPDDRFLFRIRESDS